MVLSTGPVRVKHAIAKMRRELILAGFTDNEVDAILQEVENSLEEAKSRYALTEDDVVNISVDAARGEAGVDIKEIHVKAYVDVERVHEEISSLKAKVSDIEHKLSLVRSSLEKALSALKEALEAIEKVSSNA